MVPALALKFSRHLAVHDVIFFVKRLGIRHGCRRPAEMSQDALDRGVARVRDVIEGQVKKGRLTPEAGTARAALLAPTLKYEDLGDADIIIELHSLTSAAGAPAAATAAGVLDFFKCVTCLADSSTDWSP